MPARSPALRLAAWGVALAAGALLALGLPDDVQARRPLALHAAGLVAWLGCSSRAPHDAARPTRAALGLLAGAALAHLGWALLHAPQVAASPGALLDLRAGYSILFVPAGLLLAAGSGPQGARFRADALASLPLAFAVTRLACLDAGCCGGRWSATLGARVPTAALEAGAWTALALGHERPRAAAHPARGAVVLLALGGLRLALEPWRAAPPLGAPWLPPAVIASSWVAAGIAWAQRSGRSRDASTRAPAAGAPRRMASA